jgi:hypothetical protein
MFEDYESENDEEPTRHIAGSINDLRDHVLMIFGGFIAKISGGRPTEEECSLEYQRQFLELWEVENIMREHADMQMDGAYGIGANSFEEYQVKMLKLFRALGARILSNVMRVGVAKGLLDAEYDFDSDEFKFSITEKGMALVAEPAAPGSNDSATRGDQQV